MSDAGRLSSATSPMVAIPPTKDTDAEDVVWGLQTAEALWKRGERIDAIVWLRRAAQAAGEGTDDDRALELARAAAELSDWMATLPAGASNMPPAPSGPPGPPAQSSASPAQPAPPVVDVPSSPTMQTAAPHFPEPAPRLEDDSATPMAPPASESVPIDLSEEPGEEPIEETGRMESASVPHAEHVHAGMFNPWEEGGAPAPAAAPLAAREQGFPDEEVITSVHASPGSLDIEPPKPAPVKPAPPRPPPLPARARKASVPAASPTEALTGDVSAQPAIDAPAPAPAPAVDAPAITIDAPASPEAAVAIPAAAAPEPATDPEAGVAIPDSEPAPAPARAAAAPILEPPAKLDLEQVEAFADLPDDAREAFAAAARVSVLGEGEEVSSFALAFILSGTVDVAATMVDAPAARLAAGAVLRSRGTTDDGVPMRLIGVSSGVVATWTDADVQAAFRTCPWVEEDLRTAADRLQTLVGVTIGPLGERLDASIREQIIGRLTMRTLSPGEVVVTAGQPVPGLLLVGVGELELVDGETVAGVVGSGEFLFPGEVLGAGDAPRTARAGAGGALILFGDRMIAQELLVTCPPLLEVFAGM